MSSPERIGTVGSSSNFWLYSSHHGLNLTHPATPTSPQLSPTLILRTTTLPIHLHPPTTALIIIDMQNFFLSPLLGRSSTSLGLAAQSQLLQHAIPAARKADIRVIYVNWGLTDHDMESMPPATVRAFGFYSRSTTSRSTTTTTDTSPFVSSTAEDSKDDLRLENNGKSSQLYVGLGHPLPSTTSPKTGETIEPGRMLFRDSWNAALHEDLLAAYEEGQKASPPDVIVHKNRLSGLWGRETQLEEVLEREGVRSLLFAGVNTDQCVLGTLTDAFSKGYDCIMLRDGCATTSGEKAQEMVEYNCERTWGFVSTCGWLQEAAEAMER